MSNPKFGNQGATPSLPGSVTSSSLLQQDFPYQENVDGTHPLNLDYFIPVNCQNVITARLSFRLRLYRTYSNFTASGTGSDSTDTTPATNASAESGHSHNHNHGMQIAGGVAGNPLTINVGGPMIDAAGGPYNDNITMANNANGSSGHSHSHNHGAHHHTHSHTVAGSTGLGVQEDVNNNPSVTIQFDGVDHTADIIPAGPYTTDEVELDVTKFVSTNLDRQWHTVSLQPNVRGRIQVVLRVLYNSVPV